MVSDRTPELDVEVEVRHKLLREMRCLEDLLDEVTDVLREVRALVETRPRRPRWKTE